MALRMFRDNGPEPSLWPSDRSINEYELCNIILMNHVENWLLLYLVDSWVQKVGLSSGLHFLVAVRRDQVGSVMLWLSVDSFQWLGQSSRVKAVN